jgi:hypothetical protein
MIPDISSISRLTFVTGNMLQPELLRYKIAIGLILKLVRSYQIHCVLWKC